LTDVATPSLSWCSFLHDLAAKLEAATSRAVGRVDLYHIGLVPQASRDMVRAVALGTVVSGSL